MPTQTPIISAQAGGFTAITIKININTSTRVIQTTSYIIPLHSIPCSLENGYVVPAELYSNICRFVKFVAEIRAINSYSVVKVHTGP